ncbi:glycyl-tRNA synthetase, beta subunit [Deferribacter desulfuricans SSM1]|uniref:Glycine--tRNA ligase beta subunit n=1 Tax=Deferribacter desulfuricans (strain DSM 14783 / JCM 11476 / NBRC 101012 / SSM1) TaxID=639282 RepID=D3PAX4_DEFDS|nr:glycine--tRNA ligase subunit beta [Deferribacter desulfuricans]BAI79747.1 glycyl-tRNA synthetase, beta subunit [Deferribacter desulfuricans SSM1]
MSFYILEIGTEEIPASFINPAANFLKEHFKNELEKNRINYSSIESGGTPRRLFLYIENISDRQADLEEEIKGPPANIAFDENGNLTKTALGFAKSKGLDVNTLRSVKTDKGEYLVGTKKVKGEDTVNILKNLVVQTIKNFPFPKSMKWGDKNLRFARPIHWFLSIYNGKVLEFEIEGIKAGNYTFGHRFMANKQIKISSFDEYKAKLKENFVIVDFNERKEIIRSFLNNIGNVFIDEDLLDTVANLVEYPHPILGEFPEHFLQLPKEVLITSMKNHQKYFYREKDGKILNSFVGISNTKPKDDSLIKSGYERVLKARLNDAMFFFENDKKVPLEERMEQLKKVVYQEQLGTSYEKMERFREIALFLAKKLAPNKATTTDRAAFLCKADLMTEMVYEFPELQGVMGREYALIQGEEQLVADAIFEHYLPRFSGDELPKTDEGAFISIADKIDTITGCFIIGLIPTGNNDPYALRRNAIGIINIILNKNYRLSLTELLEKAIDNYKDKLSYQKEEILEKTKEFILTRAKQIATSQYNIRADVFEAVVAVFDDIVQIFNAAKALNEVYEKPEFVTLSTSYKRISNILNKNNWNNTEYKEDLLVESEEKELNKLIKENEEKLNQLLSEEKYNDAINVLLSFSKPVDNFFDNVLVMDKNEEIRNNRLSLLAKLKTLFEKIGELSLIN